MRRTSKISNNGNPQTDETIIESSSSSTSFSSVDPNEQLFDGIEQNDLAKVAGAISRGADVDAIDKRGKFGPPLYYDTDNTPLIAAVKLGFYEVAKWLIDYGHADTEKTDNEGKTALHWAIIKATCTDITRTYYKIAELLLNNNAKVNAPDNRKITPLHEAALRRCSKELVILLLLSGANKDAVSEDGEKPESMALDFHITDLISGREPLPTVLDTPPEAKDRKAREKIAVEKMGEETAPTKKPRRARARSFR